MYIIFVVSGTSYVGKKKCVTAFFINRIIRHCTSKCLFYYDRSVVLMSINDKNLIGKTSISYILHYSYIYISWELYIFNFYRAIY